jgi:hypothetical protein
MAKKRVTDCKPNLLLAVCWDRLTHHLNAPNEPP